MVAEIDVTQTAIVERNGPGRPSLIDEALPIIVEAIEGGNTQDSAARLAGVHPKTLSRWKGENEEFAEALARAEARYIASVRVRLKECKTKWGTHDPKAIEIEVRRLPEFRQHQESTVTSTSLNLTLTAPVSQDQLAKLQAMRLESLARNGA